MNEPRERETDALIGTLAECAAPVSRLRSPHVRMATWFMISLAFAALVVAAMGLRPDIGDKLREPRFVTEVVAALMTSMLAAGAAFCAGCPGRPLWERFAPLPALAVWLASIGSGCWDAWLSHGPDGLRITPDLMCFPYIVLVGSLPAVLILAMIRRGAPIAPITATMLASLAAAALGAAALRLFHMQDASLMVLVWHVGSVALLTGIGALMGRSFLRWPQSA